MSFHFTAKKVEDSFFGAIQNLNALSGEQMNEFVQCYIDHLVSGADLSEELTGFARKYRVNTTALQSTISAFLVLLQGAIRHDCSEEQLSLDLQALGLNDSSRASILRQWKTNHEALTFSTLQHTLRVNQLLDFEWRFGVTSSSNDLKKVGQSFLQLKLVLDKGDGETKIVHMELTLAQFYKFLNEMEKAHQSMAALGTAAAASGGATPSAAAPST